MGKPQHCCWLKPKFRVKLKVAFYTSKVFDFGLWGTSGRGWKPQPSECALTAATDTFKMLSGKNSVGV